MAKLVRDLGSEISLSIDTKTESSVDDIGRPDIGVASTRLLTGHIELKAPGMGADVRKLRGRDKAQWERFRALPNLVYTDGTDWALYRSGERVARVRLPGDLSEDGPSNLDVEHATAIRMLVTSFLTWSPIVPATAKGLAGLLAPLCHLLRVEVAAALGNPGSALSRLKAEWQSYLFPEVDDAQFADAYAQTLTYALLLARLSSSATTLDTSSAERALRGRHTLLAQVLRVLTEPSARDEISLGVDLLERAIGAVDPSELAKDAADPWLYFYEDFLAAYDRRLRNDRGVYYTPVEVVRAQVALIADILINRMGRPLAFASDGVTLLDPAVGTGTYPLAAIQHGVDLAVQRFGHGAAASTATELAKNIYAFEILVGPYAVAHLRLTERIVDEGGSLPAHGVQVYLTDTLESPNAQPPGQLPLNAQALVDEHMRALSVKKDTRILVCLGNPPYDRQQIEPNDQSSKRKGGWIRFGELGDPIAHAPLESFLKPVRDAGQGIHLKNLYNDYVYFWRWALWKVFETTSGPGIVCFITASSYMRGPAFVGMRESMRRTFDELWIVDLEGDNRGPRKTENVFDIETPVAIALGVRFGTPSDDTPAKVSYTRLIGSRSEKLESLRQVTSLSDFQWAECLEGWREPFLPKAAGDYFAWPVLTDLFPWQHSGVQTKRTWPIGETDAVLFERWKALLGSQTRGTDFRETGDRAVTGEYTEIDGTGQRLPSIASLPADAKPPHIVRYGFRSFDRQWILQDSRIGDRMRPQMWEAHGDAQLYMAGLLTDVLGPGPAVTVSADMPDMHYFNGRGGKDIIPLWRDREATSPNVSSNLLSWLGNAYGRTVTAPDLFAYCYAVLGNRSFTERFSEELTIPGPHVPITKSAAIFADAVDLGRNLVCLHSFGTRMCGSGGVPSGRARLIKGVPTSPERYPEEYSYAPATETLSIGQGEFAPVDRRVWEFSVSGLEVVRSWIRYRLKDRAGRASSPLDGIRPSTWQWQLTEEFLSLIWMLEATVEMEPELDRLLSAVLASSLFEASELPQPGPEERLPPSRVQKSATIQQKRMF